MKRTALALMLIAALLLSALIAIQLIPLTTFPTYSIMTIKPDGRIEGTNQIQLNGNLYTFTENIKGSIVVQKDNIMIDGFHNSLIGNGSEQIKPGIDLTDRINVTIKNVKFKEFLYPRRGFAILMNRTRDSMIDRCEITSNTVGLWIQDSQNIKVTASKMTNYTEYGVMISSSNNIKIINNHFEVPFGIGHGVGVTLSGAKYCTLSGNNFTGNSPYGIEILFSTENVISNNYVAKNDKGIYVNFGGNNLIIENTIRENYDWGMVLSSREGQPKNLIYHNNFINNNKLYNKGELQISNPWFWGPESNTWDNGKEGNYWSDYQMRYPYATEIDSTGIGDTHFFINSNNIDRYPLMNPWTN